MVTKDDVLKVSKLVKVPLHDDQVDKLAEMFSETIDYVKVLDELDTSKVEETYQVNGLTNVFQTPENKATLSQDAALQNAPEKLRNMIVTKGVFDR